MATIGNILAIAWLAVVGRIFFFTAFEFDKDKYPSVVNKSVAWVLTGLYVLALLKISGKI